MAEGHTSGWADLFSVSSFCIYATAVGTVYIASKYSLIYDRVLRSQPEYEELIITDKKAIMYPIVASIMMLCLFYFFGTFSFLILMMTLFTSITSMAFVLYPILERYFPSLTTREVTLPLCGKTAAIYLAIVPIAFSGLILWLITGHWILNNIMGVSYCIMSLSFIKLPNIKVATIILVCLFFYDIFWVFISPYVFGDNVMVAVATKPTVNPINTIAQSLNIQGVVPELQLPMKLIYWHHMLGLGDIVVPGFLVAYALKIDQNSSQPKGYFYYSMWGYAIGLFMAMVMAFVYHIAQPALLYLVPTTLITMIVVANSRKELHKLWIGIKEKNDDDDSVLLQNTV